MVLILIDDNWQRASVPLKFQIGDIILGRATLSLFRRSARLDERPLDFGDTPEPPRQFDDADGYVVWSHPIATKLPILRVHHNAILYTPRQYRRFFVDLSGGFEGYMTTLSRKTRSGLRRKLRKFAQASGGEIAWRQYRTPEQIETFFSEAKKLSARTYQERLLGVGLPNDQDFIASALALSREDRVRGYLLFLNAEPISYLFCPISQQVVSYDHLGYDPAYASLSPGTVLQILALEALFDEQQFNTFDFTEGEGQHKEIFSTGSCLCGDVFMVRLRAGPMSVVMLHHAMSRASTATGAILDQMGIRSRLRRLVRRQSTRTKTHVRCLHIEAPSREEPRDRTTFSGDLPAG